MSLRPTAFALCGLAAVGLAACDTADGPSAAPETATGVFDAALFPDADQLIATSNRPDALDKDRVVRYRNPDALDRGATFFRERSYPVRSFQSTAFFETENEFYGTFDAEGGGGFIARFDTRGNQLGQSDASLVAPKGFDSDIAFSNLVIVADFGAAALPAYNASDLSAGPVRNFIVNGEASVWDVHIDENTGFTYVARTDGSVSVYSIDGGDAPIDEFQVLSPSGTPAVNLHGITYDPVDDVLIVSDVGLAGSDSDGAIHVLDYDYGTRDGEGTTGTPIMARATIAGPTSMLGNPVDIAGSGADLFVAEKANGGGGVFRFENVYGLSGMVDVAPAAASDLQNAESVDIIDRSAIGGPESVRVGPRRLKK